MCLRAEKEFGLLPAGSAGRGVGGLLTRELDSTVESP